MENLKGYLPQNIKGKNVLITGGTTGIGRAIAILLAAQGAFANSITVKYS